MSERSAKTAAPAGLPVDRLKVPQAFWRSLDHLGLRPAAVLRQARLPATLHLGGTGLLTTAQMFAIWQAVEALSGDLGFAFRLLEASDEAGHQPAFLAACYAADYRDAVSRVARFKGLGACELFRFDERHGEFAVSKDWPHASEPEPALLIDMSFAYLLELGRRGTGHPIVPLRIDYERPDPGGHAHRTHFGCPIRWNAPRNTLVLRSSDLDRPFPGHNREFLDLLTPALAAALGELRAGSTLAEQVKVVLKRALASGRPEVAAVARELGLSERTLQRRITDEGTTFRTLLAEARGELGRQLLSDPSMGLDEVACLLGYQDTSSFHRGFREWEGTTPSHWRAINGVGAQGHTFPALLH
ncbi:AraC family transcriptional regulator [Rubellimicrobium rubrum]|uniref:AraC family transcriptional regulator n=1 Tax=Rubellimicrobium rubrum TaxID=2585369 RepID=A0A5C4MQ53_9RHOB|nr:AraC family transcriptional regulator [Rubellimicrobium rubrum]TNC47705.1 AraC family transcriptional regulator [Rubellimicrobium rubrum]